MGECNIDHSKTDTLKKLESQKEFLPLTLYNELTQYLEEAPIQDNLNELFHFLKKYDLSSTDEQSDRNEKMRNLINS
ncbi:group-specific protein [Aquibacillus koreensis]|uniref:Group-specific protein n=1 Tax=Aquibacillus koreensis TaxID=279446 RepID=A0A9X4AII8_9BACI|nr:group-specific protein [Aquibacillus koreensis]MCT2535172.1 group-specific protein [Aquibacillus koreensis]MDC3421031.1 group-specific protein [Aquibacillus koreensis]